MSIHKTRGSLYKLAKLLGDYNAIASGNPRKMVKRVQRRAVGKMTGRGMRKLFK